MLHSALAVPAVRSDADSRAELARIAAGLDYRFVEAGEVLSTAIETIDRVVAAVDGIVGALDRRAAGGAVDHLKSMAERLTCLPTTLAARHGDLSAIVGATTALRARVMEMHKTLYVLQIYGVNVKIAAAGEADFVGFVDGMGVRLDHGKQHLDAFLARLKTLDDGIASVDQAGRLLAGECARVVPQVPDQLVADAVSLQSYMDTLGALAVRAVEIARTVQMRVGVVLGALQVGDSTRQRLEHVVAALQILESASDPDVAVADHIRGMLSAQLDAAAATFEAETAPMVPSLNSLAAETRQLLYIIQQGSDDDGRAFLVRLEQGIAEVAHVVSQLTEAEERSRTMTGVVASTVEELSHRLEGVRRIRLDVQDISINTRLLCRRHGGIGKAVSVVATEIDLQVGILDRAMDGVAGPIETLTHVNGTIGGPAEVDIDIGEGLKRALVTVRDGCLKTERAIGNGADDADQLILLLERAASDLSDQLALGDTIRNAANAIVAGVADPAIEPHNLELLGDVMGRIAALYTMAAERDVHAQWLPAGLAAAAMPVIEDAGEDDDGLF
jgi:hypothetical protein